MNVVDLLAILPYFVSFVMEELKDTQVPALITLVFKYCGSGQRSRRRFPGDRESWEGDSADQSDAHPQGFQGLSSFSSLTSPSNFPPPRNHLFNGPQPHPPHYRHHNYRHHN